MRGWHNRYDIANDTVSTVASALAEPSDVFFAHDGSVLVVESNAHAITTLSNRQEQTNDASRFRTERPPIRVAPGPITIEVAFQPPAGQKLDEQFGPSTRLSISASPEKLLIAGTGDSTKLERRVTVGDGETNGVLQVIAQAATCDAEGAEGLAQHPACHLIRQDWGVPVIVDPDGESTIRLVLHDTPA